MFHQSVDVAKTHEIMARFRPIAPKPALPMTPVPDGPVNKPCGMGLHLRSRPCRARKRGRPSLATMPLAKRQKSFLPFIASTSTDAVSTAATAHPGLLTRGLPPLGSNLGPIREKPTTGGCSKDLLTLSLLPAAEERDVPVEKNLLQKLQEPKIIVPQPLRPVGSSISVGSIATNTGSAPLMLVSKRPEEVEEEIESDTLPAVVSDSRNRVRMANSAYKEMVGQPECMWLDYMVGTKAATRRIGGEVMLDVPESSVPASSNGFSCRVKIEWACNGRRAIITAPCQVSRLYCEAKDYLFTWRFHTNEASVTYCKA
ncbi:uncharacterized protein [Typha angustifolia]|uniref:uncharacterized protein n=1 Tax=Typha angustifolia TaxID=59011 RepID=UPI003C2EBF9C